MARSGTRAGDYSDFRPCGVKVRLGSAIPTRPAAIDGKKGREKERRKKGKKEEKEIKRDPWKVAATTLQGFAFAEERQREKDLFR